MAPLDRASVEALVRAERRAALPIASFHGDAEVDYRQGAVVVLSDRLLFVREQRGRLELDGEYPFAGLRVELKSRAGYLDVCLRHGYRTTDIRLASAEEARALAACLPRAAATGGEPAAKVTSDPVAASRPVAATTAAAPVPRGRRPIRIPEIGPLGLLVRLVTALSLVAIGVAGARYLRLDGWPSGLFHVATVLGVMSLVRSQLVLDPVQQRVERWWGLLVPLWRRVWPLADFTSVVIDAKGGAGHGPGRSIALDRHGIVLRPPDSDGGRVRRFGERYAKTLGLALTDRTTRPPSLREAGMLDESFAHREWRRGAAVRELPEAMPGLLSVERAGTEVVAEARGFVVVLPVRRLSWIVAAAAFVLGSLAGYPLLTLFTVAGLWIANTVGSVVRIEASPGRLRVIAGGRFWGRTAELRGDEIEELVRDEHSLIARGDDGEIRLHAADQVQLARIEKAVIVGLLGAAPPPATRERPVPLGIPRGVTTAVLVAIFVGAWLAAGPSLAPLWDELVATYGQDAAALVDWLGDLGITVDGERWRADRDRVAGWLP